MAGRGHFYFISNMVDIDAKVLDCLQKESYEYLMINKMQFFNKHGELLSHVPAKLESVSHNTLYSYLTLVDPAKDPVDHIQMEVHDPNVGKEKTMKVYLQPYEGGDALHKLAARDLMLKAINKRDAQATQEISIKYQILDKSTMMYVAEKIVDQTTHEVKLRRIPLVTNSSAIFTINVKTLTGKTICCEV